MTRVKGTHSDEVSAIYVENRPALMRYLQSYTRDTMDAEDMLHELFLKLLSIDIINPETVRNLLFVMARRLIIDDALHKAFVRRSVEGWRRTAPQDDGDSLSRRVEAADLVSLVDRRISRMPPKRARIYMMNKCCDLSAKEIAERMRLSRRTVESHLYVSNMEMKSYLRKII